MPRVTILRVNIYAELDGECMGFGTHQKAGCDLACTDILQIRGRGSRRRCYVFVKAHFRTHTIA